uniref:Uncharacterized protein n=1 Tax=Trichogramma kaykai TaxID=54128 RepID=A0ABD2XQ44_9HYME
MLDEGYFHFLPHINTYNVYKRKEDHNSTSTFSEAQKEKFNSVMKCVYGQETPEQQKERKKIGNKKQGQPQELKQDKTEKKFQLSGSIRMQAVATSTKCHPEEAKTLSLIPIKITISKRLLRCAWEHLEMN